MEINVAQQLKEAIGSPRNYEMDEVVDVTGEGDNHRVSGEIKLQRTQRGILVKGELQTEVGLTCSRCLCLFTQPLEINFEEEYLPTIDIVTGIPLSSPEEAGDFLIDEHHVIDLTEAIRQYTLLAIPMKPLCREDCAGLCPECGQDLNEGPCGCPVKVTDPRWSKLSQLL